MTLMQKEVALKVITKNVMGQEKRKDYLEAENALLLQTNDEILRLSCLTRILTSVEKKKVITSGPNKCMVLAVQEEDATHDWCSKKEFELRQYKEEHEQN